MKIPLICDACGHQADELNQQDGRPGVHDGDVYRCAWWCNWCVEAVCGPDESGPLPPRGLANMSRGELLLLRDELTDNFENAASDDEGMIHAMHAQHVEAELDRRRDGEF